MCLCICVCAHVGPCVYTEVHAENRCSDKRPPVKTPSPQAPRADRRVGGWCRAEKSSRVPPTHRPQILRKHSLSCRSTACIVCSCGIVPTPRIRREHALIRFCRTLTHKQKILISSAAASIAVYTDQRTFWVQRGCACDRLLLYKLGMWAPDRPGVGRGGGARRAGGARAQGRAFQEGWAIRAAGTDRLGIWLSLLSFSDIIREIIREPSRESRCSSQTGHFPA